MSLTGQVNTGIGARRALYSASQLRPLIRPHTIAVVGVSESKDGFGNRALKNLLAADLSERLVAVNPRATAGLRLFGVRTVARLDQIDGAVDCVLVAVPAAACEDVVEQAARSGCRSAIVFSSGFAETSPQGRMTQERMAQTAREHGMLLSGPNTAGVMNYRDGLALTFMSDLAMQLPTGKIAIVSQSAGIATHLGHVRHRGLGVSYALTAGNSSDVTALDYVNFALADEQTQVVALAVEAISSGADFAAIGAHSIMARKPVVMLKAGRTGVGSQAAVSHTGSLTSDYETILAAAAQAGVIVVDSPEQLIDTVAMFAKWSSYTYQGGGTAVVTTMGGAGVIAADAAGDAGVQLPLPAAATVERLNRIVPEFAATANPVDTAASPTDADLAEVIVTLSGDPSFAAVTVLTATTAGPSTAERPQMIANTADRLDKPLCSVWLSSWQEMPGTEILDGHPTIAVFRSSRRCFTAMRAWMDWHRRLDEPHSAAPTSLTGLPDPAVIRRRLAGYVGVSGTLDEASSRDFLQAAHIHVPAAAVVSSAAQAAAAARDIGFSVVAKVVSADLPHKAAARGVVLAIDSAEQAADAYERIVAGVATAAPDARIDGVLIAKSYVTDTELMAGFVRDPVFGPVFLCGAGGSAAEQRRDVARLVFPFSQEHLTKAVTSLRVHRAIQQKTPRAAQRCATALTAVVWQLSQLAQAMPEVSEIDINPLVVPGDGEPVALDALVVLDSRAGTLTPIHQGPIRHLDNDVQLTANTPASPAHRQRMH
jgi:acetate---CoA ligase (ADP-forming)